MALIAAGEGQSSEVVANSVGFIKDNQNGDHGWSWGTEGDSDVDDTAAAIMALIAAGESQSSTAITDGLAYIKTQQTDNGGFLSWGDTNADTDSWAIDAIVAAGQDPTSADWTKNGNTPVDDLLSFQQGDGSFYWQSGTPGMSVPKTTAYAIQALLGKPYPLFDPWGYDEDSNGSIDKSEAIRAVIDYFDYKISKAQVIRVVMLYFG